MSTTEQAEITEHHGHETTPIPDKMADDFDINDVEEPCWICGRQCDSGRYRIFAWEGLAVSWENNPSEMDFPGLASLRIVGSECRKELPDRFVFDAESR